MRRATIETTHGDDATAASVAAAVRPDNTPEMETRVDGDRVVTTVTREATGGLRSTVDDYVVNCAVAAQLLGDAAGSSDSHADARRADEAASDADAATRDTDTNT